MLKDEARRGEQIDCFTEERRQYLCEKYNVKLFFHSDILDGIEKVSAAGKMISNDYFIFTISDSISTEEIIVGSGAGRHFLTLTGDKLNENNSFSLLKSESKDVQAGSNKVVSDKPKWNPAMLQFHNAICLCIALYIKGNVDGALKAIKENSEKFKYKDPFESNIKTLNTILKDNYLKEESLQKKLEKVRTKNKIKNYSFDLINKMFLEKYKM